MQKINFITFVFIIDEFSKLLSVRLQDIDNLKLKKQYEVLIIDNGLRELEKKNLYRLQNKFLNLRIISLSKKFSFDSALIASLDNSIGDGVLILNLLNDRSKIIKSLLNFLVEGYDIVMAKNLLNCKVKTSMRIFLKIINKLSSKSPFTNLTQTLALSRKAVNSITKIRKKNRNFVYLQDSLGLKIKRINTDLSSDFIEKINKTNIVEFILQVFNTFVSNSVRPLRLVIYFSALASFLSLLFILYVFVVSLVKKNVVEGWISLATLIGTMFFMLFVILTILSEYILRILDEVKEEPLYFIEDEVDHSIFIPKKKLNIIEKL
ncbi:MAG: glycosyl transferase [Candidatus Parcubacteria bacterium]|nr:MAG: glycosyl transferase [Candidatus Parcubacteria bacterium]